MIDTLENLNNFLYDYDFDFRLDSHALYSADEIKRLAHWLAENSQTADVTARAFLANTQPAIEIRSDDGCSACEVIRFTKLAGCKLFTITVAETQLYLDSAEELKTYL